MDTIKLQDNLNWLLIRASIVAKQRLMKLSEQYDLTPMQTLTLCMLDPNDGVPMSTISDLLACDPSNITGIVERLSNCSYIERRESSTDRRVKTISLTPEGEKLRNKLLPSISENGSSNIVKLTSEEIKTLKELLIKTLPVAAPHKANKVLSK
jgi:DNA-binding MarR family transcriptional regulator